MASAIADTAAPRQPHTADGPGRVLDALSSFLAGVRDGLGPYLAIYRLAVRGPEGGWNEAFNHAGNAASAGLAGLLAWRFGPEVLFWLMGHDGEADQHPAGRRVLLADRTLMVFAAAAFLFHQAHAATLTSVSQLLTRTVGQDRATRLTADLTRGTGRFDAGPGQRRGRASDGQRSPPRWPGW